MAKELEIKFHLDTHEQLLQLLAELDCSPWQRLLMHSRYYDLPSGKLSRLHWTLRHRIEGQKKIACLKTPSEQPNCRNEFEVPCEQMDEVALRRLVAVGAPPTLLELVAAEQLVPVCGAEFLRYVKTLALPDGSSVSVSADEGRLYGGTQEVSFLEMEVEFLSGSEAQMLDFAARLQERFSLKRELKSKYARARALACSSGN